ncbi:hypothetical protein P7C73_g6759, partial [Tremellales sp. Uapishka_1]
MNADDSTNMVSLDDASYLDAYCIVCDRLIVPPKEVPPPVTESDKVRRKSAQGTIRVKNPDGSTTTRTANGQKATRPGLRRNPTSQTRLAAVAAANNTPKIAPLTRSQTADAVATVEPPTPAPAAPPPPFKSTIYCSRQCAQVDAGRSSVAYEDIARTLSFDYTNGYKSSRTYSPTLDHMNPSAHPNTYGPPSPLFISGSDTESSVHSASLARRLSSAGPAASAPKTMEYFRIQRDDPEDAWREREHQRRSSMAAPSNPVRLNAPITAPPPLNRAKSQHSHSGASSDSLSSLWHTDGELHVARSVSGSGALRGMTPMKSENRRSMSISSDGSMTGIGIPTRPNGLPRSNLSQTSLAHSPGSSVSQSLTIPPEFGSAPSHTVSLFQSYASAFPIRDPSGTSASYTHRGFALPTPRRDSASSTSFRPSAGTIRAKSRSEATWDSFGKQTVQAKNRKSVAAKAEADGATPTQSLAVEDGRWRIRYGGERAGSTTERSRSRSSDSNHHMNGIAIPRHAVPNGPHNGHANLSASTYTQSKTPQGMTASQTLPNFNGLSIHAHGRPPAQTPPSSHNGSVPRSTWNWDKLEKQGGKTYELPKGLMASGNKGGLFYFQ